MLLVSWRELLLVLGSFGSLWQELLEIKFSGPRARQSTMIALSTALSVVVALALHMDYVWWAGHQRLHVHAGDPPRVDQPRPSAHRRHHRRRLPRHPPDALGRL